MSTRNSRSTSRRPLRRCLGVFAAAVAFTVAGAASAQPGGHHHDGRGGGTMFERALTAAKPQLNLNTSQQQQWDAAVAQTRAAREQGRANFATLRATMQAELARSGPIDFAALAAAQDAVAQKNHALRLGVRSTWLALYNTFTDEQKAVVKQLVAQRAARMQEFRQRLQQRQGNG